MTLELHGFSPNEALRITEEIKTQFSKLRRLSLNLIILDAHTNPKRRGEEVKMIRAYGEEHYFTLLLPQLRECSLVKELKERVILNCIIATSYEL